jgi:coproporphyrinogen III oxidase-like Fe-S oxidoreductase
MQSSQNKSFGGLVKNPTYNELINYIETNNDKIKMPDRRAKFIRNSFYLSQLDGEGMRRQEEQEQLKDKELDKELMIKRFAEDFGLQLQAIKQYLE